MSRREQIKMSDAEVEAFLQEERTVTCATIGPRGWPHLMPLWYVIRRAAAGGSAPGDSAPGDSAPGDSALGDSAPGDSAAGESAAGGSAETGAAAGAPADGDLQLWAWTYGSSQKALNLSRDPRATLQVEAGETYDQLRGVMLECHVEIHQDIHVVRSLGLQIFRRYGAPRGQPPLAQLASEVEEMVSAQAAKRVALQFVERRRASWDHRKLRGVY